MGRRISQRRIERALDQLLVHRGLVSVEPSLGGGADGRAYGTPVTVRRALIVDGAELRGDQYDKTTSVTATVYLERAALAKIPGPETRVTIWAGTADERTAHVERCARWEHPEITDLLEVKLR